MCLLVVAHRQSTATPLFVAANRDERYDRPTTAVAVLAAGPPRIVGGRDDLAGGTWLAVNSAGVVAALTNTPTVTGRDGAKRSRGELPIRMAAFEHAEEAAADLATHLDPSEYNPCWMLVGDRESLFYLELDTALERPRLTELGPGVHVLENRPIGTPSPKVDRVRMLWAASTPSGGLPSFGAVRELLGDQVRAEIDDTASPRPRGDDPLDRRRLARSAICVHTDLYGTRSAAIVAIGSSSASAPHLEIADGPPCIARFVDESPLFAPI